MQFHKSYFTIISLLLCIVSNACKQAQYPEIEIVRLDRALAEYSSLNTSEQVSLQDSLWPEINAFFSAMGSPDPSSATLDDWSDGQVVKAFQPDVDATFANLNQLQDQLGQIIGRANADSLDFGTIVPTAIVWGRPQPIVKVDSILLIALNHYLGSDYPGYSHWEVYRRLNKEPWAIAYDAASALAATRYPFKMQEAPTLLNWMLYEGALVETRMQLVPEAQLHRALGYTPEQLDVLEDNFQEIWGDMAARRLIYETDPQTIDRFLTSAPNTPLLSGKAPGRAGRYIGYMIVKGYKRSHPEATLKFLLSPDFYANQQSLIDSKITAK